MLILTFMHGELIYGECYILFVDSSILRIRDLIHENKSKVCMTNCQCNLKGMKSCDEDRGVCICQSPFTGDACT